MKYIGNFDTYQYLCEVVEEDWKPFTYRKLARYTILHFMSRTPPNAKSLNQALSGIKSIGREEGEE